MSHWSIDDANYYGDHRVRARDKKYEQFDEKRMKLIFLSEDDDGNEIRTEMPARYEVCPTCNGSGSHVNPSIDAGGISGSDFAEDPEFYEEYTSGAYDVPCYGCDGDRVVPVINEAAIEGDEAKQAAYKQLQSDWEEDEAFRRMQDAERRMGA